MPHADSPRSYHHGDLREALIGAGLELTRDGGADGLALRDAARRVGVSPTAVYRHFADRDALLSAVAERVQQRVADGMQVAEPPPSTSARDRLRAVGLGYIGFALREPGWFDLAFGRPGALQERIEPDRVPAPFAALSAALDALVAEGALDAARRPDAEWPCWSAVHGFALLALGGPLRGVSAEELREAASRTVDIAIDGLLA
ncbi:TetR/AcrR family transcriptional regulator [Microbacterium awajiense]|uniref:TetR/AcrR family transcriptional regulator n=1 Tax=Microbacterium awajiense TaxID=415214 RepID=A0ABP7AY00_9MICO